MLHEDKISRLIIFVIPMTCLLEGEDERQKGFFGVFRYLLKHFFSGGIFLQAIFYA